MVHGQRSDYMDFAIGIDIGGTNLKVGIVDCQGNVVARLSQPVGGDKSSEGVVGQIAALVEGLRQKSPGPVLAIGCGVPGIVNFERGIVYNSPNFPLWREEPIVEMIRQRIALPLTLDNDANMHAIGEACFGAGKDHCNMVLLTLGSGIGGGLILDGKVFHGDRGFAGEVGHIVVEPGGVPCGCGGRGCLEQYAASHGFGTFLGRMSDNERKAFLKDARVPLDGITPEVVARLADGGNKVAIRLWEEFGGYLGIGIATLINVLGVETFVIGGGITKSWNRFIDAARRTALSHTYSYHADHLIIERGMLGNDAGIVGAGTHALRCAAGGLKLSKEHSP